MNEFARTLRRLMQQQGLTQKYVADIADVKRQTIAQYQAGTTVPTLPVALRIADSFGVTLDELAGRDVTKIEGLDFGTYQRGAQRTASTVDALDKLVNGALGLAGEGRKTLPPST